MNTINSVLQALDERTIAQRIGIPHDETRMRYPMNRSTVRDFSEFNQIIGQYYNHHFTSCVSRGGSLSSVEASSRAKDILNREYRRRNGGDIKSAFNDAHDGTNGGLRGILDILAETLKADSVEHYTRDIFDRFVEPNNWEQKVQIIREFINQYGSQLGSSIQSHQPERYANDYENLIRSFVESLKRTSQIFRRM